MSTVADIATLDWGSPDLPEGFTPVDAIVLVKGYYETNDGSMTRMVWAHKWTAALANNPSERIGQLEIAREMTMRESLRDYRFEDDDDV